MRALLAKLIRLEEYTLTTTLLGLALIGAVQVFFRYILEISFDWFEEMGRYLGVFVTFLGASIGVKYGVHFSMDMLVSWLKHPWKNLLETFTGTICGICFLTIAWYGFRLVIRNYGYETTSPAMQIPMYWAYLPIPLFSVFIAIRFFSRVVGHIKELCCPSPDAVRASDGAKL